jgi:hypothetical protein
MPVVHVSLHDWVPFLLLAVVTYALYSVYGEKTVAYTVIEITYIMLDERGACLCHHGPN